MSAIFAVVDPKSAPEAVKKFRGILFPEESFDDIKYLQKAKKMFEKLRKLDLRAHTTDAKEIE